MAQQTEFIPYEQALELKELGFDEPCFGYYADSKLRGVNLGIEELGGIEPYYQRFGFHTLNNHDISNSNKVVVTSPLYQQAFRWFRETHEYYTDLFVDDNKTFGFCITYFTYTVRIDKPIQRGFNTYEEAELACLKRLIEIVKTNESATEDWPIH